MKSKEFDPHESKNVRIRIIAGSCPVRDYQNNGFNSLSNKEVTQMKDAMFVRADEIAEDLEVSKPHAYKLIREMNAELRNRGYMTVSGRVSRQFYEERFYGIAEESKGG